MEFVYTNDPANATYLYKSCSLLPPTAQKGEVTKALTGIPVLDERCICLNIT